MKQSSQKSDNHFQSLLKKILYEIKIKEFNTRGLSLKSYEVDL